MTDKQSKSRIEIVDGLPVVIHPEDEQNMKEYKNDSTVELLSRITLEEHLSETGIAEWSEGLPFPLASILRQWSTTPNTEIISRCNHLIHFFEALSQYIATILLSAYYSHEDLWEERRGFLARALKSSSLSFERASFGTWKTVIENLGAHTRKLLKSRDEGQQDTLERLYGKNNSELAVFISSQAVLDIIRRVNSRRNDVAHGGNLSSQEANSLHSTLHKELENLHEKSKLIWFKNSLLISSGSRLRKDKYENDVQVLRGSNPQFRSSVLELDHALDVEQMHLHHDDSNCALKLISFFRLGPSPRSNKNTCYFFNRIERESIRFVTYQSARESSEDINLTDCSEVVDMVNSLSLDIMSNP